ncbi:MAG: hypothetical protein NVSMB32_10620 [Actinomycetota bacterium]
MPHVPPLHPSHHRRQITALTPQQRTDLRTLIDKYIATKGPVAEHLAASQDDTLMIHDMGFLAWHAGFVGKLEHWLIMNDAQHFVPLPYWDPATPIPSELDNANTSPNLPLPDSLRPGAIATIPDYMTLNTDAVPYHNAVHDASGGLMPNPDTSPGDPIFWPFHAFLIAVYEHWRNH